MKPDVIEAGLELKNKGYRFVDETANGRLYARLSGEFLRRASVDTFGRIRYYLTRKATKIERQLYGGRRRL